jgi:hypothetical protein
MLNITYPLLTALQRARAWPHPARPGHNVHVPTFLRRAAAIFRITSPATRTTS